MIRILIVDDSPSIVVLLRALFEAQPDMQVVGQAANGLEAIRLTRELRPHLVTMDIQMAGMDGIEATRRIMQETPTPIVVISSVVDDPQLRVGFRALEVGALAVLEKPPGPTNPKFKGLVRDLIDTVRAMASIKVFRRSAIAAPEDPVPAPDRYFTDTNFGEAGNTTFGDTGFTETLPQGFAQPPERLDLVAIAASTGGPQALLQVLGGLPADFRAPIVVVQHIAEGFIGGMAEWLAPKIPLRCSVAADGERLQAGQVYLAPDGHHLLVARSGMQLRAHLFFGAPVHRHLPSATPLFQSVARACARQALGLVLTGMGPDGAQGLLAMRRAGAVTFVQSPGTCVAPSMPQTAIDLGAVDEVLPLTRIANRLKAMAAHSSRQPLS